MCLYIIEMKFFSVMQYAPNYLYVRIIWLLTIWALLFPFTFCFINCMLQTLALVNQALLCPSLLPLHFSAILHNGVVHILWPFHGRGKGLRVREKDNDQTFSFVLPVLIVARNEWLWLNISSSYYNMNEFENGIILDYPCFLSIF
jgi:hypothetical protein